MTTIIIILSVLLPSFRASIVTQSKNNLENWFSGLDKISQHWIFGQSILEKQVISSGKSDFQIQNSFLFIWNNLGIFGLILLLAILFFYFRKLHLAFGSSSGRERIWLAVFIGIFFEIILLAMTSKILLIGPIALVFWLIYPTAMNLKNRKLLFDDLGESNQ